MANCKKQQLNITCGTDVVLHDRLIFDGETFDPALSTGIAANLVNSLANRTPLEVEVADGGLIIYVPWEERNAGYYGLEVTGICNMKKWATYADALIRYTRATEMGMAEVTTESDYYDITQEVGFRYSTSPISSVTATIDDEVGTPSVDVEYDGKNLEFDFHRMKGEPMTFDDLTPEQKAELKGEKGDKGEKGNDGVVLDPDAVTIFDDLSDLEGKTDAQKAAMIPNGKVVEEIEGELVVSAGGADIKEDITWVNGGLNKQNGNTSADTNFIRAGNDILEFDKNLLISHGSDEGGFFIRVCYYDANDAYLRYRDFFGNCYVEAGARFRLCVGHNPVQTITDYTTDTVYTKLSLVLGGRSREQNYINNTKSTAMAIFAGAYDADFRSGYPEVIPSGVTSITVKPSVPKGQYILGFYDASLTKIAQYTNNQNDYAPRTITVDSGAVYFCIQSGNNDLETWAKDQDGNILWEPLEAEEETMPIREAVEELMGGGGGEGGGGGRYDDLLRGYIYDDGIRQLSNASLTLLHFSDIHGDAIRLARIMSFAKRYADFIDNIIQTGDLVSASWSSGIDFYTGVEGADKILNVIGNHDSASSNSGGWTDYTDAQCAARYITPFVSNWGVTIGTDVCYYYKDYDNGIRLIVLDRLHFDSTQKSWLLALLQSSTAKKVIIACHNVPGAVVANKACNMDVFWKTAAQDSYMTLDSDVLDAVDTFMSGGGVFICWLTGHTHYDLFRLVDGHPNQLCVTVGSASLTAIAQTYVREGGTRSEDNFNLFSVDVSLGVICVQKVGCSRDRLGRSTEMIVYDYLNHDILQQI